MLNQIEITTSGECMIIKSHIDDEVFNEVNPDKLRIINISGVSLNENDLSVINDYFKNNKMPRLQIENWQIPFLPEVEKFLILNYSDETIDLLKDNTVRKLTFWNGQKTNTKSDLTKLLIFSDTLEELYFRDGNFKNFEITLNELKKLKSLAIEKVKIEFKLIENDSLIFFHSQGSKIADWSSAANFKNLKHCEIWANHKIEQLDFLKEMTNLEFLELDQCPKVTQFPDLKHLKKLRKVLLSGNKNLKELGELKKLKNVKSNILGDGYEREWIYNY